MLGKVFLSALLVLGCLGGAAASDLQVYRKSIHSDKTLLNGDDGRRMVGKQPRQQTNSVISRSLDHESFRAHVTPSTRKISLPNIIRLYPPTDKPLHLHANMPMRFGRQSIPDEDRAPNSTPNMPQRFGRSWEVVQMCAECPEVQEAASPNPLLPQRFGRSSPYWSLLRTLAKTQLLNTGWLWAGDLDFTTSSEEVMPEKTFRG